MDFLKNDLQNKKDMKKNLLLFLAIFSFYSLRAQDKKDDGKVTPVQCVQIGVSKPLRDYFEENMPAEVSTPKAYKQSIDRSNRKAQTFVKSNNVDPLIQDKAGSYKSKSLVNWAGQSDGSCPPDPTGSVGPDYYVQAVNASPFKIFNKTTGATVGTVRQIGSLWSPATANDGDPIVLYDKFADRWFIGQMGWNNKKIYIAISTTNDPTGTYYTYTFSCPDFPDYLKFSIWQDGYYMTANVSPQMIFVFQRSQMLLGLTPKSFYKTFSPPDGGGFFCPLSADADGQLPPVGTPCPIFTFQDDGWGTGLTDAINVYSMTVDWTPATPTATIATQQLTTAPFDASYDNGWNDIPQPGTSAKLDGIGGVFTFRAQHRVWSGYNSVVLCLGVKVSATQRGIRWYELRETSGVWSIYQQGTYAPADGLYRWCGSIAMDDNGSIGMAYAVSGSSVVYPSIRYTGRSSGDPLGVLTFAEATAIAGVSKMTSMCGNRFGDYSHTSLDPSDGVTFWHTGEYVSTGGTPSTRIFSFQIPMFVGIDDASAQHVSEINVYKSHSDLNIKAVNLPSNNKMLVDIFDINGKKINEKTILPVANQFETSFNVTGLAAGTYLVRVGELNTSFQKVVKVVID